MNKVKVNIEHKNIAALFDFLLEEVQSSCGDGDILVKCKNYDAFDMAEKFQEYHGYYFREPGYYINTYHIKDENGITLIDGQESWRFTNNLEEEYPAWQQAIVII